MMPAMPANPPLTNMAIVMLRTGVDLQEAERLLEEAGGFVRVAIEKHESRES